MSAARRVVGLGRAARNAAAIKTRQPLREVVVVDEASDGKGGSRIREGVESLKEIVLDELNAKELAFGKAEDVVAYTLKPNLGVVGPRYGRLVPALMAALAEAAPEVGARAAAGESISVGVEGEEITLSPEELLVEPGQREGYALEREGGLSVALCTDLDARLVDEGLVRELVHRVQNLRREKGFEIEESISVALSGNRRVSSLLEGRWGDYFKSEVLAKELYLDTGAPGGDSERVTVDGEVLWVGMEPLGTTG
jgi:isoleucyl-tRNA synthetase